MFPVNDGVSDDLGGNEIVLGFRLDYRYHCKLEFGQYVQTHEKSSNDVTEGTLGAITMGPTGDTKGGHWFLILSTGRLIERKRFDELPMPDHVHDQMVKWMRRSCATLTFAWRNGNEIEDTLDSIDDACDSDEDPDCDPTADGASVDSQEWGEVDSQEWVDHDGASAGVNQDATDSDNGNADPPAPPLTHPDTNEAPTDEHEALEDDANDKNEGNIDDPPENMHENEIDLESNANETSHEQETIRELELEEQESVTAESEKGTEDGSAPLLNGGENPDNEERLQRTDEQRDDSSTTAHQEDDEGEGIP